MLKELRQKTGLTQEEFAKKLQIAPKTYQRYENEKTEPTSSVLIKIAKEFNISVDYLLGNNSNLIDLNATPKYQSELIKEIINLSEIMCIKLNAYLQGLKQGEKEFNAQKFTNNNKVIL